MASFHVYVEGPVAASPDAMRRLAEAMSERYGLAATELIARMTKGRFRVKANVDRETADKYMRDLAAIGARTVVEEARPQSSPSLPAQSGRVSPPIAATAPRASTPPPIAATTPPPIAAGPPGAPVFQSGLAAAFSSGHQPSDLGALGSAGGAIALSALDGSVDEPVMENQYSQPAPPPRAKPAEAPKAPRPKDVPVDMFAPPDAAEAEMKMEIAADEIEHRQRKRMSTPPAVVPVVAELSAAPSAAQRRNPSLPPVSVPVAVAKRPHGKLGPLGDPQVRFALGVLVAILLGFIPAHISASMREHSIYSAIDSKVETTQAAVDTMDDYNALDSFRVEQLIQKRSERRMIAFTSFLIWAAAGGALAFVWFRRIPWDRLDAA